MLVLLSCHGGLALAERPALRDPTDGAFERSAAPAATVTFDTRDNGFTPTRGFYVDAAMPWFREGCGCDRDFELLDLSAQYFHALAERRYGGVRRRRDSRHGRRGR